MFQESAHPLKVKMLDKISNYMNEHIVELGLQFSKADEEAAKALGREILERSETKYKPKSLHETALFLAAIHNGLMDCQDWVANFLLAKAGHALLGEPTQISGWPE